MIYDLGQFAAVGMSSQATSPEPDGNHLRWGFAEDLPFPEKGFSVYRRAERKRKPVCLDFSKERRGRRYVDDFWIDGFTLWSGEPVQVVETQPPTSRPELYLRRASAMRVHLPEEALEVTVRVVVKSAFSARAYAGGTLVDQGSLAPSGTARELTLHGQGINLIVIDAEESILIRICLLPPPEILESKVEADGWELIAGPLALPESFAQGQPRLLFNPTPVEAAYNAWMGAAIKVCLDAGDPIASALRMLRFLEDTGLVPPGTQAGGKVTFNVKAQSMLLLAAINPEFARFLCIGYVDQAAPVGVTFDYLVVGHWPPEGRYCLVPGLTRGPAPALPPPASVTATAFPVGGNTMAVGVNWTLPLAGNGHLLATGALTYDVRAAIAAPATQTGPPSAPPVSFSATLANGDDRIIPARRRNASGLDGYPEHLFTHFKRPEGWWAYQARGFDIFGRESPWTGSTFVRVLDVNPPPAPTVLFRPQPGPGVSANAVARFPVRARYLASGDPELTADDEALVAAKSGPVTVVEWNWLPEQHQLATDTLEFRVYFHPQFRTHAVIIANVGAPSATAVTVTLSAPPPFNVVGGELMSHGRGFLVSSQSGTSLAVVPSRIGKSDGTVEVGVPATGQAQLAEGWRNPRIWQSRAHVVAVNTPKPGYYRADIPGALLSPTPAVPLATGWIGVTAADDKSYAPDDPARTGPLGGRIGNESGIAVRQQIHAVHRTPPPAGPVPTAPPFASRADFHGRSRVAVSFAVIPPARYHLWRAVESSIVASDLKARKSRIGAYATGDVFVDDPGFAAWLAAEFPAVSSSALLAQPLSEDAKAAWTAWAARFYAASTLTGVLLQAIASRSPNETAFAQVTKGPLISGPFNDEFDGLITSRYLYRSQAVFPNGLRGTLSGAGLPVRLHDVVPPRSPAITRISLDDRATSIAWTRSPDADLDHYEVYRGDGAPGTGTPDTRRMTRVAASLGPSQTSVRDGSLIPAREYTYVVVAVDTSGNASPPSAPRSVRAISLAGPPAPVLGAARDSTGVTLTWTGAEAGSRSTVERRAAGVGTFLPITGWLASDVSSHHDDRAAGDPLEYRVKLVDGGGNESVYSPVTGVAHV